LGKPLSWIADEVPCPPLWKKFVAVVLLDNRSPKKYSLEFSIKFSSKIVIDVPTVEIDWGFLLGAITIIGISPETLVKFVIKIIKIKNFFNIHLF